MYCQKCGNKLNKDATTCDKCGNKINQEDNKGTKINNKKNPPYSTVKLVIGIISLVLFLLICVQSCATGIGNALADNGETSGSSGFICALFMLAGGIVSVATRNSKNNGGSIAGIILYLFASIVTIGTGTSFGDLPIWGGIAFSFGMVNLASILSKNKFFSQKKNKKFLTIGLITISIIAIAIGASSGNTEDVKPTNEISKTVNTTVKKEDTKDDDSNENTNGKYGLGETFVFDDLEITLGNEVSYTKVSNRFSNYNGQTVVKMPITVKNLKSETHSLNMFYYDIFGSQGTELDSVSAYFDDDCVDYAGDLRTGASYTKYLYFLYDGNGNYAIEFDNWSDKITIEFNINK